MYLIDNAIVIQQKKEITFLKENELFPIFVTKKNTA